MVGSRTHRKSDASEYWYETRVNDDIKLTTNDPARALDKFRQLTEQNSCVSMLRLPDRQPIALQHYQTYRDTIERWAHVEILTSLGLPTVLWAQSELDFEE